MKTLAIFTIAVLLSHPARGQSTVPREPVIPLPRSPVGTPPTTPQPDPSGVYSGIATFQASGVSGSFNQTWRVDIQARNCPDCDPGQYYLHSTNFNAIRYTGGDVERGGVYGSLNPNGRAFALELFPINCEFINPSGDIGSAPYSGYFWGGNFGETFGSPLTIRNGVMSGRVSGRDCFGRVVTADVSLNRQAGVPLPAACASIAGSYRGTFANSCGAVGSGPVTVRQTGCYLSATVTDSTFGPVSVIEGTATSGSTMTIAMKFLSPCSGTGTGTASRGANGVVTGTYTGTSNGGVGCCPPGPVSGSFTISP